MRISGRPLRQFVAAVALAIAASAPVRADDSAETLYAAALDQERVARSALASDDDEADVLASVHRTVSAYETIVRRFPRSGYCDNALWQAGVLSFDAFDLFGESRDRDAGVKLLTWLTREYPRVRCERTRRPSSRAPIAIDTASPRSGASSELDSPTACASRSRWTPKCRSTRSGSRTRTGSS